MKRFTSLAVSLLILAVLWHHIDAAAILTAMQKADPLWLSAGLAWVVPLTLVTAWRFGLLSRVPLGLRDASRLVLAASTLNLVLPSKMGDLAKSWVLHNRYRFDGRFALALVIFEKLIDLAALLLWGVAALLLTGWGQSWAMASAAMVFLVLLLLFLLSPSRKNMIALRWLGARLPDRAADQIQDFSDRWGEITGWFWRNRGSAALVWAVSLALWAGHLIQIWMFARALGPAVPLAGSMAAAALAILVGLLPFTLAGIGTRDAALIALYGSWLLPAQGAALGMLATMRYVLPALAGLPFMHDYWDKASSRRQSANPRIPPSKLWSRRLYAGTLTSIAVYSCLAFFQPGTVRWDPFAIADDARQFLSWMPRLTDPALLTGDLLADYWQSMSPPLYKLPFRIVSALGADPVVFGRLLAIPLLLIAAWAAWRVALCLTERPRAAFIAAAFVVGFLVHEDSIYSASPRAFGFPLLLLFLYGLLKQNSALLLFSLTLLGALYPQLAIVAFTMLALSRVQSLRPFRIDVSRRSIFLVGTAALLTATAMLPFALQTTPWGPTLTLDQARSMPNLMDPGARSTIVDESGQIGWFCSYRMGYVPTLVDCGSGIPGAALWNFLMFLPMLLLAGGAALGLPDLASARRNRPYLLALAAGTLWYVIAIAVAFRLHLPGRYSQRVQEVLEWLALGQMIGLWLDQRLERHPNSRGMRVCAFLIASVLMASFLSPVPSIRRPADYALIRYIKTLPKHTMIAGVSEDLNFIPALTGRAVLATPEHAIPYQLGYYRQIHSRLAASLVMISTPDQNILKSLLRTYGVDFVLIERSTIETATIPGRYPHILPEESASAARSMQTQPPALVAALPRCTRYAGARLILLDSECLIRQS